MEIQKIKNYTVEPITYHEAKPWIIRKHYAKRIPPITYAYGLYKRGIIQGVVTYGTPNFNPKRKEPMISGKNFTKILISRFILNFLRF